MDKVKVMITDTHTCRGTYIREAHKYKPRENTTDKYIEIPLELKNEFDDVFEKWIEVQRKLRQYL